MQENKNAKVKSSADTILWMIITGLVVYIVMSYNYTKQSLENFNNIDYYSTSGESFKKLSRVLKILEDDYLFDYDEKALEEGAIKGMLNALDEPYTS